MINNADIEELIKHVIAYAMLQRASGVITEKQYRGIQVAFEVTEPHNIMFLINKTMWAMNDNYERKLKQWIESNRLIIRP